MENVGNIGLYLVNGIAGNVKADGAPILHFSLLVDPDAGTVSGQGRQTQAVGVSDGSIPIGDITGHIRYTGLGKTTRLVALKGTALRSVLPPAERWYLVPFTASFGINDAWEGVGGWTLGHTRVENAPVSKG